MKLIVAGSRDIHDKLWVWQTLNDRKKAISQVVSGMALEWLWEKDPLVGGPDRYGYEWATANGIDARAFPADWRVGKSAGMRRNAEMADYADLAFVFWDGQSEGSADMINQMRKRKKHVSIFRYGEPFHWDS